MVYGVWGMARERHGVWGMVRERHGGVWGTAALAPAWLCSLSLSARRRPPNSCGLRRSILFGLACGAEGRKQSKQQSDRGPPPPSGGGGG
jgi:hypothetical protein